MIDWKGEDLSPDKDGSIERYQIVQGKDVIKPQDGALVNGEYNLKKVSPYFYFKSSTAQYILNLHILFSTFNWNA